VTFGAHAIAHGDVLAVLKELPDNEFDALLCDPPYGFSFMGKAWDYDVPSVDVWREALRVLKPGAPLIAFGGTRTFHRIAVGIEDAGFELRDVLSWMYGSGFPKSLDVSKAIDKAAGAEREVVGEKRTPDGKLYSARVPNSSGEYNDECNHSSMSGQTRHNTAITAPATDLARQWAGYGTALKPAVEPAILARKPLDGTVANNVARWGVGGLAIDACRIEGVKPQVTQGINTNGTSFKGAKKRRLSGDPNEGRWPANVCLDEEAAALLDAQAGDRPSTPYRENVAEGAVLPMKRRTAGGYSDNGGPSRFFYTAKVSTKEREYGCEHFPQRTAGEMTAREDGSDGLSSPRSGAGRGGGARNTHPTLKPISLTTWLATLIRPPRADATLLVPYSGAGSEMIGALRAGWSAVFGIEGEAEYVQIAHARIAAWAKGEP